MEVKFNFYGFLCGFFIGIKGRIYNLRLVFDLVRGFIVGYLILK